MSLPSKAGSFFIQVIVLRCNKSVINIVRACENSVVLDFSFHSKDK